MKITVYVHRIVYTASNIVSGDSLDVAEDGQQQPTLQVIEDAPG